MRPTLVLHRWNWVLWAASGLSVGCSVLLGLAVMNAASVEWRDGLMGLFGLTLAALGACETGGAAEETPWYEYDGAFRVG